MQEMDNKNANYDHVDWQLDNVNLKLGREVSAITVDRDGIISYKEEFSPIGLISTEVFTEQDSDSNLRRNRSPTSKRAPPTINFADTPINYYDYTTQPASGSSSIDPNLTLIFPVSENREFGSMYSRVFFSGSEGDNGEDNSKMKDKTNPLQYLEGTRHLFLRECKKFPPELSSFDVKNKRGIWNSSGRVVYYTGAKRIFCCRCFIQSGFVYEVVDYSGEFVIRVKGRQLLFGITSYVEIFINGDKLLGSMYQSCLNSTYVIRDDSGRIISKMQAPCFAPCAPFVFWCCNEHFEICKEDGVTEIGKITKYWGSDISVEEFQSCLGIEMDRVDDVHMKALLLGCFFLVEFQYYRAGGNGPVYFILMMLIICAVIAVATDCAGYYSILPEKIVSR